MMSAALLFHATRVGRASTIAANGLTRPVAAYFLADDPLLGHAEASDVLRFTLQVMAWHAFTLRRLIELRSGTVGAFATWVDNEPEALPALICFGPIEETHSGVAKYRSLSNSSLVTLPYRKVGTQPICHPGSVIAQASAATLVSTILSHPQIPILCVEAYGCLRFFVRMDSAKASTIHARGTDAAICRVCSALAAEWLAPAQAAISRLNEN
jgi:hypothetical protein